MKFRKARKVIRKAFKDDPEFKQTYVDNVSTKLYDAFTNQHSITNMTDVDLRVKQFRDTLAKEIIDLIVGK